MLPVATSSFVEIAGQSSPDGRWSAYMSHESGRFEVYVKAFPVSPGNPGGKWQVSNTGGRAPRWRADGRELFYLSLNGRKVMAVEMSLSTQKMDAGIPGELFSVSAPADVGDNPYPYDVTPDGQRFLIEEPAGPESASSLVTVLNWQAALKK